MGEGFRQIPGPAQQKNRPCPDGPFPGNGSHQSGSNGLGRQSVNGGKQNIRNGAGPNGPAYRQGKAK